MKNLKIFYVLLLAALSSCSNAQKENSVESYSSYDNTLQNQTIVAHLTEKPKDKEKFSVEEPYDSSDGFFKGRIIYSTKEDEKCYENSGFSAEGMARCDQYIVDRLDGDIKQKINSSTNLKQYNMTWYNNERKKIENYCKSETKRYIKANKDNIGVDLNIFELGENNACIKDSLYQVLKKIK